MPKDAETTVYIHDADAGLPEQLSHVEESKPKVLFASGDREAVLVCVQLCLLEPFPVWDMLWEWLVTSNIFLDYNPSPFPQTKAVSLHMFKLHKIITGALANILFKLIKRLIWLYNHLLGIYYYVCGETRGQEATEYTLLCRKAWGTWEAGSSLATQPFPMVGSWGQ